MATILVFAGFILYLIGAIGMIIAEFRESIIWGLLGLFTQVANLLFAILHFDECKKELGLMLLGIILVILGVSLQG